VFGVSVDSWATLKKYREELNLPFDLLSDWDRETSKKYGTFNEKELVSNRKSFLIDRNGTVKFVQESALTQPRSHQDMISEVHKLKTGTGEETATQTRTTKSAEAVFYEFYSDTCTHCIKMKPIVEEFRKKHEGKFKKFLLIPFDTSSNISMFHEFRITGTPTFVITDAEDKEVDRVSGELSLEALEKFTESSLKKLRE